MTFPGENYGLLSLSAEQVLDHAAGIYLTKMAEDNPQVNLSFEFILNEIMWVCWQDSAVVMGTGCA